MKLNSEVLAVLDAARVEGTQVLLTGQLDRKLYVAVDKALQACGFTWNRKAKAHVAPTGVDAAERLDSAILSGSVVTDADEGFFPTPPELVDRLIVAAGIDERTCRVLEPSAGTGAIALGVRRASPQTALWCVEKNALRARKLSMELDRVGGPFNVVVTDFLNWSAGLDIDAVVMNPPFARGQDVQHVTHAFELLRPGGRLAAIMSAGVTFRQNTRETQFRALVEAHGGTIETLPEGAFKASGTAVRTVLVSMTKAGAR